MDYKLYQIVPRQMTDGKQFPGGLLVSLFKASSFAPYLGRPSSLWFLLRYCLCLLLTLPALCQAQDRHDQFYFDQLTIKDGLSHNSVSSILQDQRGYL
jgi:hypothetical protein